jgi:hypothetical protein
MKHRDMPAYIHFAPEFFSAINDPEFRTQARNILIRNYFEPNEQAALWSLTGSVPPAEDSTGTAAQNDVREAVERGREGRFRIGVITSGTAAP